MTENPRPIRTPNCPYCRVDMDEGFVIDRGHHNSGDAQTWAKGVPVKHWFFGLRMDKASQKSVRSYRCPKCGLLQDYAL